MMSGHLLKCIRYQAQFSENVIFNQRRKLTNLTTLYQSDPFNDEIRNMLPTPKEEVEPYKKGNNAAKNSGKIIDRILWPRSVRKAEIENILQHVACAEDIRTTDALTLLKCCNKIFDCLPLKRLQFLEYLWSHLSVCNVTLDVDHYNERLKLYLKSGCNFSPMDILKEMKIKGISPNTTTYDQCIEYYCRKGKIKCTSPLLTEFSNQNMSMTENMYNSLIWGYYENGEIETALEMFESRIECSTRKNETYTVHMCINAEENKFHKIKDVLKTCSSNNISFSNQDILTVIYRLTVNNHTKHIDEIIPYLRNILPLSGDEIHIVLQLMYINRTDIVQKILLYFKDQYISKLFIQNLVYHSKDVHTIIDMCNFLDNNNLCENSLYWALYYSYFRDDDLCFPLLKIYKHDHKIKPHFFWPMLVRKTNIYDVPGLLTILKIMINDFNVPPCVYTLCDYVLPYLFGTFVEGRKLLVTCGINKTLIDNAFMLMYIKDLKTQNATFYVKKYHGPYFYNYIAPAVKDALVKSDDTGSLIYISSLLVENNGQDINTVNSEEATETMTHVAIDKLLLDILDDGLTTKIRVKKIVTHIGRQRIGITPETTQRIRQYIGPNMANDITSMFPKMSRKGNNYKSSNVNERMKDINI
ncbi:bicoid stability factor [Lasioglossum baleicum]|uniref:bicoid stability factor n=1 Tax=Lasioglossum baleicum TaxID=434251 RepID=UPI003FCD0454